MYPLRDSMSGDFTRAKYGEVNKSYGAIFGEKSSELTKELLGQKGLGTADITGA